MKTWMFIATLVLAPMSASAEIGTAVLANEGSRAELIKEIEAGRTALLPQSQPLPRVTVRHQPRLNAIKAAAVSARTLPQLLQARRNFSEWKTIVMSELYGESQRQIPGGESLSGYTARRTTEINFVLALRQQFAAQRADREVTRVRQMSRRPALDASWSGVFDNASSIQTQPPVVDDNAVKVEAPLTLNDPARYNKVRALLLSQGVSAQIVDTAILEGIRQKVDPMIVLSVINQESNFRKGAHNKGSDARGLMQLVPDTAADMGVRGSLYDPRTNIRAGVKYLNWIANSFFKMNLDMSDLTKVPAEKLKIVLASYNWGIGNVQKMVRRHGAAALDRLAPKETRDYISEIPDRILAWFASF